MNLATLIKYNTNGSNSLFLLNVINHIFELQPHMCPVK